MPNRLANEPSLYLRQHADNPVDWYPWGEEALARARAEDRPILLSIGYSSCHWCHVMAHESFEDADTAALMNELFVNVKVDREQRPDIDALYMQATLALTGSGGWPMTVFLTLDGHPFYAGTYFPKTARGGLPAFTDLCRSMASAWQNQRTDVLAQAERVMGRIASLADGARQVAPDDGLGDARVGGADGGDRALLDEALLGLARSFDPVNGGFGGAPKFPPTLSLEWLAAVAARPGGNRHAQEMLDFTLARMGIGGIHDQIGGGFHRYAVDERWLIPHFEKMLCDNALLGRVYALAHRVSANAEHGRIAAATFDYLLREMRLPGGGFAAAQDADSPEGEGAFFAWSPAQLAEVLDGPHLETVVLRYGISEEGNFAGDLSVLAPVMGLPDISQRVGQDAGPLLMDAHRLLYAARSARPAPTRDDKVIAGWNGLTIAGLADAGVILGRADYLDAATATAAFLLDRLVVDGRLRRNWMDGRAIGLALLDDHADLCHGLIRLHQATGRTRWLTAARELAQAMQRLFGDGQGGFYYSGEDDERLAARTRDLDDHPTPSGNAQAALVLLRLSDLVGEPHLEDAAMRALERVRTGMERMPHAHGTALLVLEGHLAARRQVAIAGPPDDERTGELVGAAREALGPHDVLAVGDPAEPGVEERLPLLHDRPLVDGRPAAYVCRGFTCRAPVTDVADLRGALVEDR